MIEEIQTKLFSHHSQSYSSDLGFMFGLFMLGFIWTEDLCWIHRFFMTPRKKLFNTHVAGNDSGLAVCCQWDDSVSGLSQDRARFLTTQDPLREEERGRGQTLNTEHQQIHLEREKMHCCCCSSWKILPRAQPLNRNIIHQRQCEGTLNKSPLKQTLIPDLKD